MDDKQFIFHQQTFKPKKTNKTKKSPIFAYNIIHPFSEKFSSHNFQ